MVAAWFRGKAGDAPRVGLTGECLPDDKEQWWGSEHMNKSRSYKHEDLPDNEWRWWVVNAWTRPWPGLTGTSACLTMNVYSDDGLWTRARDDSGRSDKYTYMSCHMDIILWWWLWQWHLSLSPTIAIDIPVMPVRPHLGYLVPIVRLRSLVNWSSGIIVSVWGRHLAQFYYSPLPSNTNGNPQCYSIVWAFQKSIITVVLSFPYLALHLALWIRSLLRCPSLVYFISKQKMVLLMIAGMPAICFGILAIDWNSVDR